jgi:hypothetical protein
MPLHGVGIRRTTCSDMWNQITVRLAAIVDLTRVERQQIRWMLACTTSAQTAGDSLALELPLGTSFAITG